MRVGTHLAASGLFSRVMVTSPSTTDRRREGTWAVGHGNSIRLCHDGAVSESRLNWYAFANFLTEKMASASLAMAAAVAPLLRPNPWVWRGSNHTVVISAAARILKCACEVLSQSN